MNKDRILVQRDGEEIEVFNHVSVTRHHYVNAVSGHESFEPEIAAGDDFHGSPPDAVTPRVAQLLRDEWRIQAEQHGIEVIDPDDEEVHLL